MNPDCTTHFKDGGGTSTLIDCRIQNTLQKNQVEEIQKNRWTVWRNQTCSIQFKRQCTSVSQGTDAGALHCCAQCRKKWQLSSSYRIILLKKNPLQFLLLKKSPSSWLCFQSGLNRWTKCRAQNVKNKIKISSTEISRKYHRSAKNLRLIMDNEAQKTELKKKN